MEEATNYLKYKTILQTVPVYNTSILKTLITKWEAMSNEELATVFKDMHNKLYELNRAMLYFKNKSKDL